MKLSASFRAGIQHLRPVADSWSVGADAPEWRDVLLAVALIALVILGGIIAPRLP